MAWSKVAVGTPEYMEYMELDHKLWDYASAHALNEYEDVIVTAMKLGDKYRTELQEAYEGYWHGKYDKKYLEETMKRIDEQTKDGLFNQELLAELNKLKG